MELSDESLFDECLALLDYSHNIMLTLKMCKPKLQELAARDSRWAADARWLLGRSEWGLTKEGLLEGDMARFVETRLFSSRILFRCQD